MGTDKEFNRRQYLEAIRARHTRTEQRKQFGKNLVNKAKALLGKTPETKEPAKQLSQSAYVKEKKGVSKGTDMITPPRPTPANSYIQQKRKQTQEYSYIPSRGKAKIPYPVRS